MGQQKTGCPVDIPVNSRVHILTNSVSPPDEPDVPCGRCYWPKYIYPLIYGNINRVCGGNKQTSNEMYPTLLAPFATRS